MSIKGLILKYLGENISIEYDLTRKYFSWKSKDISFSPMIIFSMDGKDFTNGFADRLRGILGIYAYAKARNIPFRILHEDPFPLEHYFEPNNYDWILQKNEKTLNKLCTSYIVLLDYTKGKRLLWLPKFRQYHIASNINTINLVNSNYSKQYNYKVLFNELFKPSEYLLNLIKPYEYYINKGYISISFRFMQLMGDFKDIRGKILSEDKKNELCKKCIRFVEEIHENNPEISYLLVTADSQYFINKVRTLDYVFTAEGSIGHIGHVNNEEVNDKMITDFYLISLSKKAYMGHSEEMYKGHFAESAANTTGIEYKCIEI